MEASSFVLIEPPHLVQDQIFLLSTPRSGTNLTISSLQIIAKIPCLFVYQEGMEKSSRDENLLLIDLDFSKKPLLRIHHYSALKGISSAKNRLIFLTRNPKEIFLRNFGRRGHGKKEKIRDFAFQYLNYYLKMFRFFDDWDPSRRLLVYYEDILLFPKKTLKGILKFLGEEERGLSDYMNHMDAYRMRILESYHQQHESKSKGKDILYYSKQSPQRILLELDAMVKEMDMDLWNKYLYRFET